MQIHRCEWQMNRIGSDYWHFGYCESYRWHRQHTYTVKKRLRFDSIRERDKRKNDKNENVQKNAEGDSGNWMNRNGRREAGKQEIETDKRDVTALSACYLIFDMSARRADTHTHSQLLDRDREEHFCGEQLRWANFLDDRNDLSFNERRAPTKPLPNMNGCERGGVDGIIINSQTEMQKIIRQHAYGNISNPIRYSQLFGGERQKRLKSFDCKIFLILIRNRKAFTDPTMRCTMPRVGDFSSRLYVLRKRRKFLAKSDWHQTEIERNMNVHFDSLVHMFSNEENMIMWIDMQTAESRNCKNLLDGSRIFFRCHFRSINLLSRFIYPIYPCCNTLCMTNIHFFRRSLSRLRIW